MLGLNLQTRPEEIYRALLEATAYGARMILDTIRDAGIPVTELYAAGGVAQKDAFIMQIYADVMNMDIKIAGSVHTPAWVQQCQVLSLPEKKMADMTLLRNVRKY